MKLIEHLQGLISSRTEITKRLWDLFLLEAQLAGKSLGTVLITFAVLIVFIMTFWLALMGLIAYAIIVLTHGYISVGLASILIINIIFFIGGLRFLLSHIRNLSFEKTRASLYLMKQGDPHELSE